MSSMTTIPPGRQAFAGIDTHKRTHHSAVIDSDGHVIADREFAATPAGGRALLGWLTQWPVATVGVEQTGTYGADLTRRLTGAGLMVIEVNRPDPVVRAGQGKSDPIDAVMAAEAVRTGRAGVVAKDRSGVIESIRQVHTARRSAVKARTQALVQAGALAVTLDAGVQARLGTTNRQITANSLRLRPDLDRLEDPTQAGKLALRSIADRVHRLDHEIQELDRVLGQLVHKTAPHLLALPQVGINAAAQLLITAGQNPDRIHSEAAFARLVGVAPIPASSGQTHRMRLHRGGDRQANKTIHMIAVGRLRAHQPAIDYVHRRQTEGLSKKDAIRAMKRLITRQLYGALKADLNTLDAL